MTPEAVQAWLTAAYDEDEMRAAGASKGPWHWQGGYPQRISNDVAIIIAETTTNPDRPAYNAEYIAWNHPARRLVAVAAMRRRLARHTPMANGCCDYCHDYFAEQVSWPCPEIIDDAQAYTDRADFPDELRLDGS